MSRPTGSTPFPQRARSLAPRQIGAATASITTPETPIPVRAWLLTVAGDDLEVDAEAVAWTTRAVQVRYVDKHGHDDTAWVWAGAVTRH